MSIAVTIVLVFLSILAIIFLTSKFKFDALMSMFGVSVVLALCTIPVRNLAKTLRDGFGSTMGSIGFLIIFGAVIGIILDKTKATYSMANWILSKTGRKRAPAALAITGYITGLPIFCNSGFIVLSGLMKSFSAMANISLPLMASILGTALYSVHCLIPTHPGALAAAGIVKVNIGYMIVLGALFALPGAAAAFFWSKFMTRHEACPKPEGGPAAAAVEPKDLPPAALSFLPIVLPLLLITLNSSLDVFKIDRELFVSKVLVFLGEPAIALLAGVVAAVFLLKKKEKTVLNAIFSEAIEKAGPILIVTAAGGMFGTVIQATGAGEALGKMLSSAGIGLLVPFLVSAMMKTAQGSSTVAFITSASFVAPMLPMLGLGSEWGKLLSMMAMGAGSMSVSHANDSYFWVVSRFSDIDVNTTLRVYSTATLVMGVAVFVCVWLTSLFIL